MHAHGPTKGQVSGSRSSPSLVTNAVLHGRPLIELRLRRTADHVTLEVCDGATFLPRRLRPTPEDEHGRGLQLVALLADRWGTRPTQQGKSVWCVFSLTRNRAAAAERLLHAFAG